jgi:DNA repair protein RadC
MTGPTAISPRGRQTGKRVRSARALVATSSTIRVSTRRYSFHVVHDEHRAYPLGETCDGGASAAELARHVIGDAITEVILALFLDTRHRILGFAEVARGTLNATRFKPKDVLIPALLSNASAIILAHNHPSGDATPSAPDRHATTALREAAQSVGIPLVDHLVVTAGDHHSFAIADAW